VVNFLFKCLIASLELQQSSPNHGNTKKRHGRGSATRVASVGTSEKTVEGGGGGGERERARESERARERERERARGGKEGNTSEGVRGHTLAQSH
jgi:hypothetical protein